MTHTQFCCLLCGLLPSSKANDHHNMICADIYVVDSMVYMGAVNKSNLAWHVLIYVVCNNIKEVRKRVTKKHLETRQNVFMCILD